MSRNIMMPMACGKTYPEMEGCDSRQLLTALTLTVPKTSGQTGHTQLKGQLEGRMCLGLNVTCQLLQWRVVIGQRPPIPRTPHQGPTPFSLSVKGTFCRQSGQSVTSSPSPQMAAIFETTSQYSSEKHKQSILGLVPSLGVKGVTTSQTRRRRYNP